GGGGGVLADGLEVDPIGDGDQLVRSKVFPQQLGQRIRDGDDALLGMAAESTIQSADEALGQAVGGVLGGAVDGAQRGQAVASSCQGAEDVFLLPVGVKQCRGAGPNMAQQGAEQSPETQFAL